MKQLGLGIMQYVQDYDETYPMALNYYTAASGDETTWVSETQPYVKNMQVFICPSSGSTATLTGHYGANKEILRFSSDTVFQTKIADVQSAATIYMVMDYGIYYARTSNIKTISGTNWDYLPGMGEGGSTCQVTASTIMDRVADCQSGRHFGGVNMTFADGHAKWLKSSIVVEEARKPTATSAWFPTH